MQDHMQGNSLVLGGRQKCTVQVVPLTTAIRSGATARTFGFTRVPQRVAMPIIAIKKKDAAQACTASSGHAVNEETVVLHKQPVQQAMQCKIRRSITFARGLLRGETKSAAQTKPPA